MKDEVDDIISLQRVLGPEKTEETLRISDYMLKIIEPSGRDFFGDGAPLLGIHHYSGGSEYMNDGIIALHLDKSVQDATPKFYHSEAFSRDGHAIIAYYVEAKIEETGCGNCIIRVRLAFHWQGKHLLSVCRHYPQLYDDPDQSKELHREMQDQDFALAFDAALELALNKLQAGHFDEAAQIYRRAKAEGIKKQGYMRDAAESKDDIILHPHRNRSCPLILSTTKEEKDSFVPDYAHILSHPLPYF